MDNSRKNLPAPPTTIDDLQQAIGELRQFVARRFDEVSFEVNATGQIMGMTEEAMAQRFSEVMTILNIVSFKGDGTTPHNVGVELQAVVQTTEDAANKILDAATTIADLTRQPIDWNDETARTAFLTGINMQTDAIFAACAFQDLTGQRIALTLENIRKAETDLADTLKQMGLKIAVTPGKMPAAAVTEQRAGSQADIDALFG